MDDKNTAKILIKLLDRKDLSQEEKEALQSAIGILSWTSLAKSNIEARKNKLKKMTE